MKQNMDDTKGWMGNLAHSAEASTARLQAKLPKIIARELDTMMGQVEVDIVSHWGTMAAYWEKLDNIELKLRLES